MQATPSPTASPPACALQLENDSVSYSEPPVNSKSPPFGVLTGLYEKLQNERKPEKRRRLLASWLNHWREEVGRDLYPVLRLILPQKDRERSVYGLKEKNLAKTYIKLIPLGTKDTDAVRLLNWKRPTENDKTAGDFPSVLFEVISKRSSVIEGSLTIDDINKVLDDLCKNMGKQEIQARLLQHVYNKTTPKEQRWIARIILKDMNIQVKETSVFSAFHPDAHDLFNTCSDLKKVAWELWDPTRRLNEEDKTVQLFRAFAPMLCKRPAPKIDVSIKDMEGGTFIIEEKLDGERIQLHKRGNEYFYCSRKGKDYTYLYGAHIGTGSLTPYIAGAFDERVEDIILDGEMLVWDPISERNLPFGTLKTAALDTAKKAHSPRPCFKVFDLLYLNGTCMAQKSTKFRKRSLRACVREIKGRLEFVIEYEGRTSDDVRKRLEDIIEARGEGLILKHPQAQYVLNGRNKDWIKVKPEYMDNMGETVDVLVMGANYGKRGTGGVSTLICGVLDDRRTADDDEPKYSSFVRIGTGLSYADYVWIRQKPWKVFDKKNLPSWYQAAKKSSDDKGDVYIEPEDSFILKVKAAEITASDQYHLGFTMRFPRALSIRDDLSIADCMTSSAVLESMRSERKRKAEQPDGDGSKKRRKTKTAKKPTILPEYQGPKLKDVPVETDLFDGLKFMVASDPKARTGDADKRQLLKLIHINGGSYVQVASGSTPLLVVYGGQSLPYDLKRIKDKDVHDIIRPQWIHECISRGERVPLTKKYFFHATSDRQLDREYNLEDDDKETDNDMQVDGMPTPIKEAEPEPQPLSEKKRELVQESEEPDSAMSEWFRLDGIPDAPDWVSSTDPPESDTDPESDFEEANEDDEGGDWFMVKSGSNNETESSDNIGVAPLDVGAPTEIEDAARMGEEDTAMEYDTESIFKHLCFYLDSPENAKKHGMSVKSKYSEQISKVLADIGEKIVANGGRIVDLDDIKLTHIVIDKRDDSRRTELMRRTSKPKRRNLVISDFINACVAEDTLLDEEEFAP